MQKQIWESGSLQLRQALNKEICKNIKDYYYSNFFVVLENNGYLVTI